MKLHPRLSRAAVELVTRFETFQPQAQPTAAGGWTIGYGHMRSAREGAGISRSDAEALLLYDLDAAAKGVEAALFAPATQRQFEALTAFAFNIGADNFRRSTALARMNGGAELEAADEIERWRHAELGAGSQVVDALVRRRAAEKAHFLGLPEGCAKSPSALVRPLAIQWPHGMELPPAADPPPLEPPASSATLTAANSVQARLRELVPDPEPPPPSPAIEEAPIASAEMTEGPEAQPTGVEAAGEFGRAPTECAPYAPPPPPPPILEAAPTSAANDPSPPPHPAHEAPPTSQASSAPTAAEPVAAPPPPSAWLSVRSLYAGLTALGACLVVIAVVLILAGKPGFTQLGLGVLGALTMIPGVYGLMSPARPAV